MYKKTDKKNELFLCVIYRSPSSRDDNNKQLLDLIVELCGKRVDKLVFIGYYIDRYSLPVRYSHWTMVKYNQLRQHGGTPLVVE